MRSLNRLFITALLSCACFFAAPTPSAMAAPQTVGLLFYPSFSVRTTSGSISGDQTTLLNDWRLGYVLPAGVYFGVAYANTKSVGNNAINQTASGASLGYFFTSASIVATYYMSAEHTEDGTAGSLTRFLGNGYQFDGAYTFPFANIEGLFLGPVLSYRAVAFRYSETNGVLQGNTNFQTYLYPYIGVMYVW